MARGAVVAVVLLALAWGAFEIFASRTTDRVEDETERLLELARAGGEEAAAELLAALAGDYRDDGVPRAQLEHAIRTYVAGRRIESLKTLRVSADWLRDEIVVLAWVRVGLREGDALLAVSVHFAERDGAWRFVAVRNAGS